MHARASITDALKDLKLEELRLESMRRREQVLMSTCLLIVPDQLTTRTIITPTALSPRRQQKLLNLAAFDIGVATPRDPPELFGTKMAQTVHSARYKTHQHHTATISPPPAPSATPTPGGEDDEPRSPRPIWRDSTRHYLTDSLSSPVISNSLTSHNASSFVSPLSSRLQPPRLAANKSEITRYAPDIGIPTEPGLRRKLRQKVVIKHRPITQHVAALMEAEVQRGELQLQQQQGTVKPSANEVLPEGLRIESLRRSDENVTVGAALAAPVSDVSATAGRGGRRVQSHHVTLPAPPSLPTAVLDDDNEGSRAVVEATLEITAAAGDAVDNAADDLGTTVDASENTAEPVVADALLAPVTKVRVAKPRVQLPDSSAPEDAGATAPARTSRVAPSTAEPTAAVIHQVDMKLPFEPSGDALQRLPSRGSSRAALNIYALANKEAIPPDQQQQYRQQHAAGEVRTLAEHMQQYVYSEVSFASPPGTTPPASAPESAPTSPRHLPRLAAGDTSPKRYEHVPFIPSNSRPGTSSGLPAVTLPAASATDSSPKQDPAAAMMAEAAAIAAIHRRNVGTPPVSVAPPSSPQLFSAKNVSVRPHSSWFAPQTPRSNQRPSTQSFVQQLVPPLERQLTAAESAASEATPRQTQLTPRHGRPLAMVTLSRASTAGSVDASVQLEKQFSAMSPRERSQAARAMLLADQVRMGKRRGIALRDNAITPRATASSSSPVVVRFVPSQ